MHGCGHRISRERCRCCVHMRPHHRPPGVTRLRHIPGVSFPLGAALPGGISLLVRGSADGMGSRRKILGRTPGNGTIHAPVLWSPDFAQQCPRWHLPEPCRSGGITERITPRSCLLAHLFDPRCSLSFPAGTRESLLPGPERFPQSCRLWARSPSGAPTARRLKAAHMVAQTHHIRVRANLSRHVGGSSSLPSSCLEPAFVSNDGEHLFQEPLFGMLFEQM